MDTCSILKCKSAVLPEPGNTSMAVRDETSAQKLITTQYQQNNDFRI
jgi:hypothetical protein